MCTVVLTAPSLGRDTGGPARNLSRLASALADEGFSVDLVTQSGPPRWGPALLPGDGRVAVFVEPSRSIPGSRYHTSASYGARLQSRLEAGPAGRVILHDNGVWTPANRIAGAAASGSGVKRMVSPRGMLTSWALRQSRTKKKLAWWAFQKRALQRADAIHATSMLEAEDIVRLGITTPIVVVPNGVELTEAQGRASLGQVGKRRQILFLSRLHPKKGLPLLVEAWARVRPAGWTCVVAGPDEGGHRAEVERLAVALGLAAEIQFLGPIADADKWGLYDAASVFVLPSLSESYGTVVAEALATGLPVITTTETPWGWLEREGCGWSVDATVEGLSAALREATSLSDHALSAMGTRGKTIVEARFSWSGVARELGAVYRWLLGEADAPPSLISEGGR